MDYTWHVFAIFTTDGNEWRMFRDDKVIGLDLGNKIVTVNSHRGDVNYRFDSIHTGMTLDEAKEAIESWNSVAPDEVVEKIKAIQEKIK